ncbi:hypothetical protein BDV96DRAFT_611527 [Lophiotrema nucula]|uniref:NAD(P)-binding protein n=1 Tax=Lophiotrema nucula TaxID=690887 RepID=A0A6A5ZEI4_9PLEO|nr:hypothetical protein BDV96DRAFT_611527 [Lophiotrema nucula]
MLRVFLITGSSRGLGHALAQAALDAGDYVVATSRKLEDLSFNNTTSTNYLPLKLDVTSTSDIYTAFQSGLSKFGRIDVVINNAAFGLIGPLETLTDEQVRNQFDVNFFPVVTITRLAVKTMREQSPSGGVVIQITSVGGLLGFNMVSAMCASKFAIEGFTDAVRMELKPEWNIKIMSVLPGHLETEAHTKSMEFGALVEETKIYDHMDGRAWVKSLDGQKGLDPGVVAKEVVEWSKREDVPNRMVVGANEMVLGIRNHFTPHRVP